MKKAFLHQKRVAEYLLLAGKNVILQSPTGSGKFLAGLMPFLNAWENKRDFPKKCIYCVPMRVLANQFYESAQRAVKQAGMDIRVTIQTGENPGDPEFAGDLIFTTIDQALSRFLLAPYGISKSQANVPAGALIGAYLIFDEFHLFDADSTLPTTLQMLKMLKGISPFLLMTATFSRSMLNNLSEELDAVIVPDDDAVKTAIAALPSQQKQRIYRVADDPLTAERVLQVHEGRSIVICNTVKRARKIFDDIQAAADSQTQVLLLHSRFLKEDRARIEQTIRTHFAEGHTVGDFIVVSTQVIEVGLDITSTQLHTELAPANSIIQRAGRCARYKDERGIVTIYHHVVDDDPEKCNLLENTLPYTDRASKQIISATYESFLRRNNESFSYEDEQEILSDVHGEFDRQVIARLKSDAPNYFRQISGMMSAPHQQAVSQFVRDVLAQTVTIHEDPEVLRENPFSVQGFSLHPGSLQGMIDTWLDQSEHQDWAVKFLFQLDVDEADVQLNQEEKYKWVPIYDKSKKRSALGSPLIVVHPALATYDPIRGFIENEGGTWQAPIPNSGAGGQKIRYRYQLETYATHIQLVEQAFRIYWKEAEYAAKQLESHFGWEQGSVRHAAEWAVRLHDVGKLTKGWQGWVQKYQAMIEEPIEAGMVYAHTDFNPDNPMHDEAQRQAGKRPWHAVESRIAVLKALTNEFGGMHPLTRAVFTAIARHHAPFSSESQTFQLIDDVVAHIGMEIPLIGMGEMTKFEAWRTTVENHFIQIDGKTDAKLLLVYLLIVRALRRADHEGTRRGSHEWSL